MLEWMFVSVYISVKPAFYCGSFYSFLMEDDSGNVEEEMPVQQVNDFSMIMEMIGLRMGQWDLTLRKAVGKKSSK